MRALFDEIAKRGKPVKIDVGWGGGHWLDALIKYAQMCPQLPIIFAHGVSVEQAERIVYVRNLYGFPRHAALKTSSGHPGRAEDPLWQRSEPSGSPLDAGNLLGGQAISCRIQGNHVRQCRPVVRTIRDAQRSNLSYERALLIEMGDLRLEGGSVDANVVVPG